MSLFKIAWRSMQQRALSSWLTGFSMALGVALVVSVLVILNTVDRTFRKNTGGYNLIIGAKGGRLDLVLNTVYHLRKPVGNIPYDYFLEYCDGADFDAGEMTARLDEDDDGKIALGTEAPAGAQTLLKRADSDEDGLVTVEELEEALSSAGRFYSAVGPAGAAIPYCLGDNYKGHRVVGTTPQMFEIEYPDGPNMVKYGFSEGRNLHADYTNPERFYEAVVGADAARQTGLSVGDHFKPSHGVTETEDAVVHDAFKVVGVLEPTGTPNDRALFVNMEGFYLLDGHSLSGFSEPGKRLPIEEREVTAILLRTDPDNPIAGIGLPKAINRGKIAQAVAPQKEIFELFDNLVGNIQLALVVLTVLIVVVAGVGIMVSIYNSMNDRLRDIAVMRALGAGRSTVMGVVLLESIMLSLGGGIGGFLLGHGLIALARPAVAAYTGVTIQFLQFVPIELALIPGLIVLATIAGFVPALKAYCTDVSRVLSASP